MRRTASRSGLLLSALAISVAAFGCSSNHADPPPLPKVHHHQPDPPADRDMAAVTAALQRIDPCRLIDIHPASFPVNAAPEPRGPHRCSLESRAYDKLRVTVGVPLSADDRYGQVPLTLAGHKAYLNQAGTQCRLAIPVSFTRSIELSAELYGPQARACRRIVTDFGSVAVRRLARPPAHPADQALARWNTCTALRTILGPQLDGRELLFGEFTDGMDRCGAWSSGDVLPDVSLEFEYGSDPAQDRAERIQPIDGHSVRIYRIPQCVLAWNQGPSGVDGHPAQVVTLTAPSCAQGKQLTAAAIRTLGRRPPPAAKPQTPLTFRADEPDVAAVGACADLQALGSCEPYFHVPVPAGAEEIRRHVAADANVNCALAVDAVREKLGREFRPVINSDPPVKVNGKTIVNSRCVFIEPTHATRVMVSVSGAPGPQKSEHTTTIAGRIAWSVQDTENLQNLFVAIGHKPEDGQLAVTMAVSPPRGTYGDPDQRPLRQLRPLVTAIVEKYF